MSFRVLVIPEDPTNNGYILKPLIEAILAAAGKPQARVSVLTNPRLRGFADAMEAIRGDLVERYAHLDLWVFMPDADLASEAAMVKLEMDLQGKGVKLLCCPLKPEAEIVCCAAHAGDLGVSWQEAREHSHLKEEVFDPLLSRVGDRTRAGEGRDLMAETAVRNLPHLYNLCPELRGLHERIADMIAEDGVVDHGLSAC